MWSEASTARFAHVELERPTGTCRSQLSRVIWDLGRGIWARSRKGVGPGGGQTRALGPEPRVLSPCLDVSGALVEDLEESQLSKSAVLSHLAP